ncbi:hypothetical protein [Pedobacter gandavensis]|uniref:hypothetical protein n=1 Tax=Pedobacter gandavensis TaxID=2679963 RepID=UPI00292CDBBD|nr:hypothetical protein [Pedobacter gandavensis]
MDINIYIAPEFEIACDILYLKPEELLQAFIDNVSLPYFNSSLFCAGFNIEDNPEKISTKKDIKMIATEFTIGHSHLFNHRLVPAQEVHKEYIKNLKELLERLKGEPSRERRYQLLVFLYDDWRKEIITEMSEKDAIIDVKARKIKLRINSK